MSFKIDVITSRWVLSRSSASPVTGPSDGTSLRIPSSILTGPPEQAVHDRHAARSTHLGQVSLCKVIQFMLL